MFILMASDQGAFPQALSRYSVAGGRISNPSQRLSEIRSKIVKCENRVRDLEALLTELILSDDGVVTQIQSRPDPANPGKFLDDGATYVNADGTRTADQQQIRQQLYAARAEEGELRTAEQFWQQVVSANKEAEKDTHDLFKRS